MPGQPQPKPQPSPRRVFVVAVFAGLLALVLALSFGYADHDPRPHGVRIAVSAPAAVSRHLAAGLQHAVPGGFDLISVPTPQAAISAVRAQSTAGALIVPATGLVTIVTAGAGGTSQQQAITVALTAASAVMHREPRSLDVAPLPAGDRAGLSSFVFVLALLIPSVLGSVGLFLVGLRFRLWWRVTAGVLFALIAACGCTLVMDTVFGALTGAAGGLIAVGFLGALSFVLFVAAIQAVVGLPGTGLAALAFIFVGNAISGGSVPVDFLPNGFRQIAPWLPNGAIVRGVRDVVYFGGHGLGHPLLVLFLWPAISLVVLAAVDFLHLAERRRTPDLAHEIYMTPGFVHFRRQLARRGSQTRPADAGTVAG
jgi:hypothetical protein